jgi:soluble cytochrome b562
MLISLFALVFVGFFLSAVVGSQEKKDKPPTSNQLLMRDKVTHMSHVLEGITLDEFTQVEKSAAALRQISKATSWHIDDPTPQYKRLSKNFQEQATDLERHAKEGNVEAATLDLVRLNVTCTQCHQHMRDLSTRPN